MSLRDSVVVMPAAHRPEFAALALEQLGRASYCPPIHLYVDDVSDKFKDEFWYVFENYAPEGSSMLYRSPHTKVTSGCWNISTSILDGYNTGAEYVFLVEEDVLVYRDFFEYHWAALSKDIRYDASVKYVSCGRACCLFNSRYPTMYTNPGSCFTRHFLDRLVPHINDEFFQDPGAYMAAHLPFPITPGLHGLDDGLIRRVLLRSGMTPAIPPMDQPHCAHVGCAAIENKFDFVGEIGGEIQARIDGVRNFFKTVDRQGDKERYLRDLDPFPAEWL